MLALLVVSIVATLSMVFLQLSLSKNKEQRGSVDSKRAFYMAEAGLAEAFNGLCVGQSGNVGSKDAPACFANGLFFVTAKEEANNRITLDSTGLCGAGRATLSIVIERVPDSIGAIGFFGDQSLLIEKGALIDSYDSRDGPYPLIAIAPLIGVPLPTGARVGCNGDIAITGSGGQSGATIYGDARPGPQGTLFRARDVTISGSTAPNTTIVDFPAVVVPSVPNQGSVDTRRASTFVASPTDQGYADFHVRGGGTATFVGPATIVIDLLTVDGGGVLELDGRNGPVKLIVARGLQLASGSFLKTLSTDTKASSIQIAGSVAVDVDHDGTLDPPATIDAKGTFYGTIYAPGADIAVPKALAVYGGISAQHLTVLAGAKIHYDRALAQTSAAEAGTPRFLGWRIVELPNVPLVSLRFDALSALRAKGLAVVKSKDAHYAVGVEPD